MWLTILYVVLSLIALYVLTATVFLATVRIEKGANGKLILDPNAWHFKVVSPLKRRELMAAIQDLKEARRYTNTVTRKFEEDMAKNVLASYSPNLCAYFFKFFLMLYLFWPAIGMFIGFVLAVTNIVVLPFGYYAEVIVSSQTEAPITFTQYPLWRIKGKRLLPIYFIIALLYAAWWYADAESATFVHKWTLYITGTFAVCAGIGVAIAAVVSWYGSTDKQSVSMFREWVSAKKQGMCPLMEIKIPDA
ncbi:MAG: hypothetical protein HYY60_03350 [Parcubacteria group bacterium]|nr:hypothetical protein [Parcubacteria group bacterium]